MDIVLGIRVEDHWSLHRKRQIRGILFCKDADDKTRQLNSHNLMAYSGEAGDTVQFCRIHSGQYSVVHHAGKTLQNYHPRPLPHL